MRYSRNVGDLSSPTSVHAGFACAPDSSIDHDTPRRRIALTPPSCLADPTPTRQTHAVTHPTEIATGYHTEREIVVVGALCGHRRRHMTSNMTTTVAAMTTASCCSAPLLTLSLSGPTVPRIGRGSTTVTSAVAGSSQVSMGAGRYLDRRPAFPVVPAGPMSGQKKRSIRKSPLDRALVRVTPRYG